MNLSFLKIIAKYAISIILSWIILEAMALFLRFNSLIPIWAAALVLGIVLPTIHSAYMREAQVTGKKYGNILSILRMLAIAITFFILMQPVFNTTLTYQTEQTIAVLVDTSDSMRHIDREWNTTEKLSLAYEAKLVDPSTATLPTLLPLEENLNRLLPWLENLRSAKDSSKTLKTLLRTSIIQTKKLQEEFTQPPIATTTNQTLRTFEQTLPTLLHTLTQIHKETIPSNAKATIEAYTASTSKIRLAADEEHWQSFEIGKKEEIDSYVTTNRLSLALGIFTNSLPQLGEDYNLRYFSMGSTLLSTSLESISSANEKNYNSSSTEIAQALEQTLLNIPTDKLSGILMLTDGIDNGDAAIAPISRSLGARHIPVSTILVGSTKPPRDLTFSDITAPESIFLGDKVRIKAEICAEQATGEEAVVELLHNGEKVDETKLPISEENFRRTISMSHSPTNNGLCNYELRINNLENEAFPSNNTWKIDVAVSDDRIHVLLIDDFPRWEFRYLRNLFFARDKSVHLQYYLHHPDTIADITITNKPPAASASRPFGDAEAGALPENEDEWRKFDTIILGDVGPDLITPEIQRIIKESVEEKGTLLVTIAGRRAMPHSYTNDSALSSIMPCVVASSELGSRSSELNGDETTSPKDNSKLPKNYELRTPNSH